MASVAMNTIVRQQESLYSGSTMLRRIRRRSRRPAPAAKKEQAVTLEESRKTARFFVFLGMIATSFGKVFKGRKIRSCLSRNAEANQTEDFYGEIPKKETAIPRRAERLESNLILPPVTLVKVLNYEHPMNPQRLSSLAINALSLVVGLEATLPAIVSARNEICYEKSVVKDPAQPEIEAKVEPTECERKMSVLTSSPPRLSTMAAYAML